MAMVSNWFYEKRGRAMGITTAGQGLGGFVLSPLSIYLISNLGWRASWGIIGLLTWVIMIPSALFAAKHKPEDMGLIIDGKLADNGKASSGAKDVYEAPPTGDRWAIREILKMPAFWFIALLNSLYLFGHLSIFQHGFSMFTDKGIPAMTAGTMIGILGLLSLSGKIALGYLSDRISVRYVMIIGLALAALSILPLFWTELSWGAWVFIVFWGFWECGVIALQPLLVASLFDRAIIGKMLGIFNIFMVIPQLIGAPFMGYIFDITGSYNWALSVFVVFYIISAVLVFFTRPPRQN
jgi:MFS family permease